MSPNLKGLIFLNHYNIIYTNTYMYIICECVTSCGMMMEREEYVQFFTVVQMKPEHDIM